jgi:hypothetical protein
MQCITTSYSPVKDLDFVKRKKGNSSYISVFGDEQLL